MTATMRVLSYVALPSLVVTIFLATKPAHAAQVMSGHMPQAVKSLNLQPIGRLSATNRLHLAIGLPLRNQDVLNALLRQIYDPVSPQYRHYLTTEQFTEKFGPTKEDYQAVMDFAKVHGLAVTTTYPNRALLDVKGSVADVEKALHVTMRVYKHPTEGRTFYAPDPEPSPDLAVPILHIGGLDNYSIPRPLLRRITAGRTGLATPNSGSGPGGGYMGNDFRAAYVPGAILNGAGQSIGLLEYDGYYTNDITTYESQAGLPNVTLVNVPVDGGVPTPGDGDDEVSLDIEMVISMAPGASHVIVYEAPNLPVPWEDLLQRMANDNLAKQISCSWFGGGPDPAAEQALVQMALQGQSFFAASGDGAAYTGTIDFPSDSTNITEVGGTSLSTTGPGGSYASETTWGYGNGTGSGGGISTFYSIPPWQQGVITTLNQGSTIMRNVPDVALTAANVYIVFNNGRSGISAGTSCAAPLWAGFAALMNQQAVAGGHPTVGFLNPALYAIGKGSNYASCFHDITTGNNEWSGSTSKFSAVTGYDLCTGWGTPNGTNLINAFTAPVTGAAIIAAGSTLTAEGCTPTNDVIDPNEPVTVSFGLQNIGVRAASNVVATLLATGGVASPSGARSYGTLIASDAAVSQPFTFVATGTCGGAITATLQIQTNATNCGTVAFSLNLGTFSTSLSQNFDSVSAPALPAGWTTSASGSQSRWVTSTAASDTAPNAAFSPDPASVGVNELDLPGIPITSRSAQLTFRNNYNLAVGHGQTAPDAGVLEIKIGAGSFTNIVTAGGTFASGGYTGTITGKSGNPLTGQQAWMGNSGGYITTTVNLPAAAAGQTVQLRWRCGTSGSGGTGWYIDTISLDDEICCTGTSAPVASFTGSPTNGTAPLAVIFVETSTGSVTNRFWDFGDGTTTNVTTNGVSHTYSAGTYSVTLVATGPGGSSTNSQPNYITVLTPFEDWQIRRFGSTNNPMAAPNADPDGDGFSNLQEFLAGTDPTDPGSALRITSIVTNGPDIVISFTTCSNKFYDAQYNDDLTTSNWGGVATNIPGTGAIVSTNDPGAASLTNRFYRVRLVP